MEITYDYQIANLEVAEGDIVTHVHYRVVAITPGSDMQPVHSSVVKLESPIGNIVEFNQLSKDLVVEWVKNKIDTFSIEEDLKNQLQEIISSTEPIGSSTSKLPVGWNLI